MANGVITFLKRLTAPSAPAVGKTRLYIDDSGSKPEVKYINEDGNIYDLRSVYGSNLETISEFYTDTSTSVNFKTYGGTTYAAGLAVAGQKYKITFSLLEKYSSLGRNFICRIALDGVTLEQEISFENKDSGSDIRIPVSYTYIIDGSQLNNAGGFLDVDYRCQQNGDTATVYSCSMEFIRIK